MHVCMYVCIRMRAFLYIYIHLRAYTLVAYLHIYWQPHLHIYQEISNYIKHRSLRAIRHERSQGAKHVHSTQNFHSIKRRKSENKHVWHII